MQKERPVDVGLRHEALIVSKLLKRGLHVLLPHGFNRRYDLVLDLNDRFVRVQCKSARLMNGAVGFNAVSTRSNRRETLRRSYTAVAPRDVEADPAGEQSGVEDPHGTRLPTGCRARYHLAPSAS
jgi:hypothetical protein